MLKKLRSKIDGGTIELLRHGKNYVYANLLVKGLSIISIPIMTRLLTPTDYGTLAVFTSLVAILTLFYDFGLRGAITRYYYEEIGGFSSFFTTNLTFIWIGGFFLSLLVILFKGFISQKMNIPTNIIPYALTVAFTGATFALVQSYLQASKQSSVLAKVSIIQALLSLVVTISLTYYLNENRYLGSIYSTTIFSFAIFIFSLFVVKKIGIGKLEKKHLVYSLPLGLPLVLHGLSGYVLNTFDQIMINKMVGATETGLYSFAYKVGMLFQLFLGGMTQSWTPIFFEKLENKDYDGIDKMAKKYAYLISVVAVFLVVFTPILVKLLASEQYYYALPLIPIILIGFLFQFLYTTYVGYAFYAKKTGNIAIFTMISGGANIVLNALLIPRYGYAIAAWTTVLGYLILFILHYLNVKLVIKPKKTVSLSSLILPVVVSICVICVIMILKKDLL